MTTQIKLAIIGFLSIALFGLGWHFGDKHATEKYLPKIQKLQDAIDQADKDARQKQAEYKENNDEIQRQNDKRINDIREYYRKRLLQSMPSKTGSSSTPSDPKAANGTASESTITGCPASIEEKCALDANQVNGFREWAVKNKIPVSVD